MKNSLNESTKVQNPRHMCGIASDGVMTNCTMILKCNFQNDAQLHALLNHNLNLLPSHLSAQTIMLKEQRQLPGQLGFFSLLGALW